MATKSYTDLEQSERLTKILPFESADMFCADVFDKEKETHTYNFHILSTWGCNTFEELKDRENKFVRFIPCWPLAALLDILPKEYYPIKDHKTDLILGKTKDKWCVLYWDTTGMQHGEETLGDNPVDACYKMILKLKEKKLI